MSPHRHPRSRARRRNSHSPLTLRLHLRHPHPLHPLPPSSHNSQSLIGPPIRNHNRHPILMRPPDLQRLPKRLHRPRPPLKPHLDPLRVNFLLVRSPVQHSVSGRLQVQGVFQLVAWARRVGTPAREDLGLDLAVEEGAVFGFRGRGERGGEGPFDLAVGPEPGCAAVVVHVSVEAAAFAEGDGFGTHCFSVRVWGIVMARDGVGDLPLGALVMWTNCSAGKRTGEWLICGLEGMEKEEAISGRSLEMVRIGIVEVLSSDDNRWLPRVCRGGRYLL
ncbi:hypothetical protein CMEL01_04300 [Colletotrichum melonis]|uniref:Uncharacterized protein n=1 Tax=Colletotrichum melonis TaxID=1209925 RepID=A0AAI9UBY8_9PEZI|nr:hypothetical protein CMEL01_04300 [Colletotrichum melonis]